MIGADAGRTADEEAGYKAAPTRSLKRLDLRGKVTISLDGGTLRAAGDREGMASVPVATIDRIRVGWEWLDSGKVYRTTVWRRGEEKPLILTPYRPYTGYAEVTRRLAAEVAAAKGVGAVERGVSIFAAWLPILFMAALAAAIPIGFLFDKAVGSSVALVMLIPIVAILYFSYQLRTTHLPRPMRSLDELDIQLP